MISSAGGRVAAVGRVVTRHATNTKARSVGFSISASSTVVYAGAALWAVAFGGLSTARYRAFLSERFDLGNMVQAVWSTAQGHPLRVTSGEGLEVSRLGVHVDPVLAALVPLWRAWPSPEALLVFQAIALALGSLPVYWLARKHLGSAPWGACLAFVYLLYAPVQWIEVLNFHPVTLAVPLLLFGIWFLDEDRLLPFLAVGAIALLTKEEIGLVVGGLGVWYAIRRGRRLAGTAIALGGVAWTFLALYVVIPHFSGGNGSPFLERYAAVGGSPIGFLEKLATDPGRIIAEATTADDLVYVGLMLVPLLGLCLLEPLLMAAAFPELALNLLSSEKTQTSPGYQYVSGIVPFLVAATALGVGRLRWRPKAMRIATVSVLFTAAMYTAFLSPLTVRGPEILRALDSDKRQAMEAAIARVPARDPVTATNMIGGHLSARRYIYNFPVLKNARWVVVDRADRWLAAYGERPRPVLFERFLIALKHNPRFELVFSESGVYVFKRRAPGSGGRQVLSGAPR